MSEAQSIEYRDVPGYLGYRVGDDGSVWSRWRTCPNGRFLVKEWTRLKPSVKKDRTAGRAYWYLNLTCESKRPKTVRLHRMVLEAFVGACPPGMECRHLDGNPANNALLNLAWGTPEENRGDCRKHGRYSKGADHPGGKLTPAQVKEIRHQYTVNAILQKTLAKQFGVTVSTISSIVNRTSWKHI